MSKLKLVIDTNTWISALISDSHPRRVVEFALSEAVTYYCQPMFDELADKLQARRIAERTSPEKRRELLGSIRKFARKIKTPNVIEAVCADKDDDIFFACALAAGATYLISSDKAVLEVPVYKEIYTMRAKDFLEFVHKQSK